MFIYLYIYLVAVEAFCALLGLLVELLVPPPAPVGLLHPPDGALQRVHTLRQGPDQSALLRAPLAQRRHHVHQLLRVQAIAGGGCDLRLLLRFLLLLLPVFTTNYTIYKMTDRSGQIIDPWFRTEGVIDHVTNEIQLNIAFYRHERLHIQWLLRPWCAMV